jgi:CRISPR/Cas system CMR-associated protein Cmr5 small subunit
MKRVLILLTVLGLLATPAFASKLEATTPVQKHATVRKHAVKKHAAKKQRNHLKKRLAKRATRKHKIAV